MLIKLNWSVMLCLALLLFVSTANAKRVGGGSAKSKSHTPCQVEEKQVKATGDVYEKCANIYEPYGHHNSGTACDSENAAYNLAFEKRRHCLSKASHPDGSCHHDSDWYPPGTQTTYEGKPYMVCRDGDWVKL